MFKENKKQICASFASISSNVSIQIGATTGSLGIATKGLKVLSKLFRH